MEELLREYGKAILVFVVIIALVTLLVLLLKNDTNGVVYGIFKGLLDSIKSKGDALLP